MSGDTKSTATATTTASATAPASPPPSTAIITGSSTDDPSFFKSLAGAMNKNKVLEFANYAQFGTTNAATGAAAVRTVRMRSVLPEHRAVMFSTDARSDKIQDLRANPIAELCWFFPLTKEQFRITCRATLVGAAGTGGGAADAKLQALRVAQWSGMVLPTRQLFDAAPPGTAIKRVAMGDLDRYDAQPANDKVPSPNFVLILLHPFRCDHLTLPPSGMVDPSKVLHHDGVLKPARQQRRWLHTLVEKTASAATATAPATAAGYEWKVVELNP